MSPDVDELVAKLRAFTEARNWSQFHSPKNLACALSAECGELLEIFQWLTEEQSRQLDDERKQAVAMETADVLIYLLHLCDALGIDPVREAHTKIALNEARYPVDRTRGTIKRYTEIQPERSVKS